MRTSTLLPLAVTLLLALPAGANAAQRYAAPSGTATGPCPAASPCGIVPAVNGAASGDEVIVTPGTYSVDQSLQPLVPVDLHGVADQARPRLVGSSGLAAPTLTFNAGGTVRHLSLEATASVQDALALKNGLGEDLLLFSATGDGAKVVGASPATVLRDTVVQTTASETGAAALKLRESGGPGDVALRNVTAMALNGTATAIRCEVQAGQATLVNTIVRGAGADLDASVAGSRCAASHSNLRPEMSPGVTAGAGNQSSEPIFANAAGGDFHALAASPTVDAGTADPLLGTLDPDGRARTLGAAPDMGAYESPGFGTADPSGTPSGGALDPAALGDLAPQLHGVPVPVQGATVVVAPGQGKVLVRRPGARIFRRLGNATRIPVGSTIDVRHGRVQLVSAVDGGRRLQVGTFWGAQFLVSQRTTGDGMTDLALRGGSFRACRAAATGRLAMASRRRPRRVVRSLWGSDNHGRFRTRGQDSVATVRGTRWLTQDRCDGTLTRVASGSVAVRDLHRRTTVLVKAGRAYLARG